MDENSNSVYSLITKLCEKISGNSQKPVKKLRARCYEILLSKTEVKTPKHALGVSNDPICNLLAWKYELVMVHNRPQLAEKLQTCIDKLENESHYEAKILNGVLQLLYQFRKLPPGDCSVLERLMNTASSCQEFNLQESNLLNSDKFKLPSSFLCQDLPLSDESFHLHPKDRRNQKFSDLAFDKSSFCTLYHRPSSCQDVNSGLVSCRSSDSDQNTHDEGYMSPVESVDEIKDQFWEEVSKLQKTTKRTWESYGDSFPVMELPFVSENDAQMNILAMQLLDFNSSDSFMLESYSDFVRDVKFLLVGIESNSFVLNEGVLTLKPGLFLSGITPEAVEKYCSEFLFCGNCFKALQEFVSADPLSGKYGHNGYIFTELCEGIKRHLLSFRVAILSIPVHNKLLTIHAQVQDLMQYIKMLAGICKVGPCGNGTDVPLGGALINYLCRNAMESTCHERLMVLSSLLYPCCQVYFNRFLQLWILEGVLKDPYNEFFIKPNLKYISVRGRNYWTRSYSIDNSLVPEFLQDIKHNILSCGKSMQLLKVCVPLSPLCTRSSIKIAAFMSSCLTADQIRTLERNVNAYYLDASLECSPSFSMAEKLHRSREFDAQFMQVVSSKRLATLRRLELERQKKREKQAEMKAKEMEMLKEQYDLALREKYQKDIEDIHGKIAAAVKDAEIKRLQDKLIEEEAMNLIKYYEALNKVSESKIQKIKKHTEDLKVKLPSPVEIEEEEVIPDINTLYSSSTESFTTTKETPEEASPRTPIEGETPSESETLDVINANVETTEHEGPKTEALQNYLSAQENFMAAKRNRAKVMSLELGMDIRQDPKKKTKLPPFESVAMTEAQRNKLRVMTSEFGIQVVREELKTAKVAKSDAEINKLKAMSSNECFYEKNLDNMNFINQNMEMVGDTFTNVQRQNQDNNNKTDAEIARTQEGKPSDVKKELSLEFDQPTPMSVDSTPLSEIPSTPSTTNFANLCVESSELSQPTTAATNFTEEGFNFKLDDNGEMALPTVPVNLNPKTFSKRIVPDAAAKISNNCLQLFMQQSVMMPMHAQMKLTNSELLKYFVDELHYLDHLSSLRNYFFLQDGEFSRNITEGLFETLYAIEKPMELMNFRTLQMLVQRALGSSTRPLANTERLSFKINSLPKKFNLGDLEALDCLSLSYAVEWPLNMLLPQDTLVKYDDVFKYLLKLHRVSWVMKRIFQDMKTSAKQVGKNRTYLMTSPQFVRLHQYRHQMTHFIQTFQNYIVDKVLHSNWIFFEENLMNIKNLDQLYAAHVDYLKNIIFMCLLKQEAAPVRKVFEQIFVVILKFYDYLRSRRWILKDGFYEHPNFIKLENIFFNFEDIVLYLFKVGQKIIKTGYQPHLAQLLDILDANGYYANRMHYLEET